MSQECSSAPTGLVFAATIAATPEELSVSYYIENKGSANAYVLDALFELQDGRPRIEPSLVYTVVEGDALTLLKGVLPIPPGLQVEAPEVPYARLLAPSAALEASFRLAKPVRYRNPYHYVDEAEILSCARVRLRVGCITQQGLESLPEEVQVKEAKLYRFGYRQAVRLQKFVETPLKDDLVPVALGA